MRGGATGREGAIGRRLRLDGAFCGSLDEGRGDQRLTQADADGARILGKRDSPDKGDAAKSQPSWNSRTRHAWPRIGRSNLPSILYAA